MSAVPNEQRTLGQLLSTLAHDSSTLIRQEIELAKVEMSEKAAFAGKNAAMIAAGGMVLYTGVLAILAAVIIGLGHLIGYGWSALIVGVIVAGAGAFLVSSSIKKLRSEPLAPTETKETVSETVQWAKRGMR